MPLPFACPACGFEAELPDVYRGQRLQCSACAAVCRIPAEEGGAPQPVRPSEGVLSGDLSKVCPFCSERIATVARKCKFCGEIIDRDLARAKKIEQHRDLERTQKFLGPNESKSAIASLSVAIVGIFAAGLQPGLAVPCGIVAATLGFIARGELARKPEMSGWGMSLAGIVIGVIGIIGGLAMLMVLVMHQESLQTTGP